MASDPDCFRRGLEPRCHLRVAIAPGIPRQEPALAGSHALQHSRDVLRGARGAVGLEPALLCVCHSAMRLARLWQHPGQRAAAYELLAPLSGWFTEGFETADLQEAKTLVGKLGV